MAKDQPVTSLSEYRKQREQPKVADEVEIADKMFVRPSKCGQHVEFDLGEDVGFSLEFTPENARGLAEALLQMALEVEANNPDAT